MAPVLAQLAPGTQAGTSISNTATATYEDDDGNSFDASSNTVTVTVAEVAGIEITASGTTNNDDNNDGNLNNGDTVDFDFTVTNVGNDPTRFRIPTPPPFQEQELVTLAPLR